MGTLLQSALVSVISLTVAAVAWAGEVPSKQVVVDQGVDRVALAKYHYTDQGTRPDPGALARRADATQR